jgi:alkyl hydroperoxide reductase subunit AhpC
VRNKAIHAPAKRYGRTFAEQQVVLGVQTKWSQRVDRYSKPVVTTFKGISEFFQIGFKTCDGSKDRLPLLANHGGSCRRRQIPLSIGETAPDFRAETTHGSISFHEWMANSWCVLFPHPRDFTPVCTELAYMARIKPEFDKRGVKIVGLSVDSVDNHAKWSKDIAAIGGVEPNYPMIGDTDLKVAKLYGMLPASASGNSTTRTPADNAAVRTVYVIGSDSRSKP